MGEQNEISFERQKCEALQLHKHFSLEYYEEELKFQIYGGKKLIHFVQNTYISSRLKLNNHIS